MPNLPFDTFFKALRKGDIPRAIYLHGPEDVLKGEAIAEILERTVEPSLRDFNVDQRSAAELDPEQAETLCNTLPMMADRRVVIIREVEAWAKRAKAKAAVLRFLDQPAPETILVLIHGASEAAPDPELAARTTVVAAESLPPERARKWLMLHAGKLGVQLDDQAADHMVKVTDGSLGALRTELEKLAGLSSSEPLDLSRVAEVMGVRHGETAADWRDAALRGETRTALQILEPVLSQPGVSGVSLVQMLGLGLIGIGLARSYYDRGARGSSLVQAIRSSLFRTRPPARLSYDAAAAEWSRLTASWPRPRIEAALRAALRADERLKNTALSDERAVLVDLLLELELKWPAAA